LWARSIPLRRMSTEYNGKNGNGKNGNGSRTDVDQVILLCRACWAGGHGIWKTLEELSLLRREIGMEMEDDPSKFVDTATVLMANCLEAISTQFQSIRPL
jgi:hypothetical protein